MGEQIVTQYENYQELLLDLDIFGRLSSTKQLNLDEYKDLFFEEFKKQKPMPTMESKRYELSRLVDNSYRVEYNRQLELRENERLVDFNEELDEKEDKANRILENIEIDNNVKNLFQYENKVCDRDREEIIKKYSLENGELLQGVRPEKLMGTIQEDDSLKLDDIEIGNLGAEVPKFHDEEFQPLDDYEEEENKEQETEDDDFDAIAFSDDVEIDAEENLEDDSDSDSDEEQEEDSDSDSEEFEDEQEEDNNSEEQEEDFDNDSEEELEEESDRDSEEEPEEDSDEYADNSEEDIGEKFEYEEDNNSEVSAKNIDNELEDTKTKTSDLSVEQLLSLLGSKLDANIDLDKLKQFVADKPDNSVEPDSVLTEQKNDSKQDVTEVKTESKKDTIDDFFGSDDDDLSEFFEEKKEVENSVVKKHQEEKKTRETSEEDLSEFFEESPKAELEDGKETGQKDEKIPDSRISDKSDSQQSQQLEVKEPEPTDLRAFIRKHPRCDYDFATQYFTPKQIAMEIKKGRVIKKGNMLKI